MQDPGYLVNRLRRSVRCPGHFGARLRAGTSGARSAGVGDGVLIHPGKAFFAVGDGSDRNPRAVRRAMEGFVSALETIPGLTAGRVYGKEEAARLREAAVQAASGLVRDLYPSEGCTFTGVLLFHEENRSLRGLLFHSGDSLLYRVDVETGEVRRLTKNDFWFLGRTDRFSQVEEISLRPSSRLLMASDGLAALLPAGKDAEEALGGMCRRHPVEEVPDLLLERYDRCGEGLDDASLLCLAPSGRLPAGAPLILGGTSAEEEARRNADIRERPPEDCYRTPPRGPAGDCTDIF